MLRRTKREVDNKEKMYRVLKDCAFIYLHRYIYIYMYRYTCVCVCVDVYMHVKGEKAAW